MNVLLVDDHPLFRDGLRSLLERMEMKFRIRVAVASGLEALALVESALGASVPAIIVTGDTRPERLRAAREIGHLLLYKPLAPMRLRAALTSALLATAAA